MSRLFSMLLLLCIGVSAQTSSSGAARPTLTPPSAAPAANPMVPAAGPKAGPEVPATAAVITIHHCDKAPSLASPASSTSSKSAGCENQITRGDFEKFVQQMAPKAPPTAFREIATSYAQLLTFAAIAKDRGVEQDPEFNQRLEFERLKVMAQLLEHKLQTEASQVTDQDIQSYYEKNPKEFEEVTLRRLFIPKAPPTEGTPDTSKVLAEGLQKRAAAGEDLDKLQKEAVASSKSPMQPPTTNMGSRKRGTMPPDQEDQIFALSAGQVSQVFDSPGGLVIYKVETKQAVPLDRGKDEIKRKIETKRLEELNNGIFSPAKADLNETYFGSLAASGPPSPMGAVGPRGGPGPQMQAMPQPRADQSTPVAPKPVAPSSGPKKN